MPDGWERVVVGESLGLSLEDDEPPPPLVGWDEPEAPWDVAAVVSDALPVPVAVELRLVVSEPVALLLLPVLVPVLVPAVVAEPVRPVRLEREVEEVWERESEEEVRLPELVVVVVVVWAVARVARRAGRRREVGTFILGGRGGCFGLWVGFVGCFGRGTALLGAGRGWERGKGREGLERQGDWSSFKAG